MRRLAGDGSYRRAGPIGPDGKWRPQMYPAATGNGSRKMIENDPIIDPVGYDDDQDQEEPRDEDWISNPD